MSSLIVIKNIRFILRFNTSGNYVLRFMIYIDRTPMRGFVGDVEWCYIFAMIVWIYHIRWLGFLYFCQLRWWVVAFPNHITSDLQPLYLKNKIYNQIISNLLLQIFFQFLGNLCTTLYNSLYFWIFLIFLVAQVFSS